MKYVLLALLLLVASLMVMAVPQGTRPPLSKDELNDLLTSSAPSKVIISTVREYGIAFEPTHEVLEEFRKSGADTAVLAALREAWHSDVPKPLGDQEIRIMLAEDVPSENIVRAVQERGIDFQPSGNYLEEIRSEGAQDVLIETLRAATPRPFSKDELWQLLTSRMDQDWIAQRVQERGIDFDPGKENLQTFQNRGALAPFLEAVRTAKRVQPFVAQIPPQPPVSRSLVQGISATLICATSDKDVPVFADPNDLGNVAARLQCGDHVTFMERVAPLDRIQYANGKQGFVAESNLKLPVATARDGVTAPVPIYKPEPQYTPEAGHDGIEGTLTFRIVVDSQGNVTDVQETSKPLGEGLDQSAMDTVKMWKFTPAKRDGVPVAVRVLVAVRFHLNHNAP